MKHILVLALLALGLAEATPLNVPAYTVEGKPYFDVLWIAQQHKAAIFLSYSQNIKVNSFTLDNKTYYVPINLAIVQIDQTQIQLSDRILELDHYPIVPLNDFHKIFPDLEADWAWMDPAKALRGQPASTPQVQASGFTNEYNWFETHLKNHQLLPATCLRATVAARKEMEAAVLGCALLAVNSSPIIKQNLNSDPHVQSQQWVQEDPSADLLVTFTLPNSKRYSFRTETREGKLWLVFAQNY